MLIFAKEYQQISHIVHLAAQAGVRYSLENPYAYGQSNLIGQLNMLELARNLPALERMVYASSSSVYGANTKLPFAVSDRVDHPISLYAATKRSCELMAESYGHLFDCHTTGLRFFTVYGPWGRPDMSAFIFTKAILAGEPLPVFNQGNMQRNFTYVDDIVAGTIACMDRPQDATKHKVYNIGNNKTVKLMDMIQTLERLLDKKAELNLLPMQPGDVQATVADIEASQRDFGYQPKTDIEEGMQHFVKWYREYYAI